MQLNADKASRLFMFLSAMQKKKDKVILSTAKYEKDGGKVLRLERLKEVAEESGRIQFGGYIQNVLGLGEKFLAGDGTNPNLIAVFKKPEPVKFPALPVGLEKLVGGSTDDPLKEPKLDTDTHISEEEVEQFQRWLEHWRHWAVAEKYALAYQKAFEIQTSANQQADEFELILGLGNLAWQVGEKEKVDRQLFSVGLTMELDKRTGDIHLELGEGELKIEMDPVPAQKLDDSTFLTDVKEEVAVIEGDILDPKTFADLGAVTANGLDTNAVYTSEWQRQNPSDKAVLAWQPTIILRKRQRTGFASALKNIAAAIEESGEIPAGLAPLIDPNSQTELPKSIEPGATFESNNEVFTPLPLNEKQLQVLNRVDSHPQTIVQGPPGTGKTHMAAALLSHLLAQGKRVLVTAEADRALYELRGKLPQEIRELAVSVISSGQSDLAELKVAVDTINRRSSDYDEVTSSRKIRELEQRLNQLREERTAELRRWTSLMESEKASLGVLGYDMQMSRAVEKWLDNKEKHEWFETLQVPNLEQPFPLDAQETDEWFSLLASVELNQSGVSSTGDSFDFGAIPTVDEFKDAIEAEAGAADIDLWIENEVPRNEWAAWTELDESSRADLEQAVNHALNQLARIQQFSAPWMNDLLRDSINGNLSQWKLGLDSFADDFHGAQQRGRNLAVLRHIEISGHPDSFVPMARSVQDYLQNGGQIKTKADGLPKTGLLTKQVIKEAAPFFEGVRVNGMPPTGLAEVNLYLEYVEFEWALNSLQQSWRYSQPAEYLSPIEKLGFWQSELQTFTESISQVEELGYALGRIQNYGFRADLEELTSVSTLVERLQEASAVKATAARFSNLISMAMATIHDFKQNSAAVELIDRLEAAMDRRNASEYESALERAQSAASYSGAIRRRNELSQKAKDWSALLVQALKESNDLGVWRHRIQNIEEARLWSLAGQKIAARTKEDPQELSRSVRFIDSRISKTVAELAAARAWSKAVGKDRIDPATQSSLVAYSQAVTRLGKGTGKYAERRKRDVRKHLDACRSAVPVWIMPIYKVVEQFDLEENMFDVVIVDEASQSGVDAIFLQYLAPRMVVIGDDKQVSPTSFHDLEEIGKLAQQYLWDFDKIDSWSDPARSLFDEANMRYGGRITLEEHRRCVPEIIGFSNQFIYEPENISLKPVREVQSDRLAPFKITQTPNAFFTGAKTKRVNTAEADVLVERLLSILNDSRYSGKTIGVISLLSTSGQAKYIQARLLEKVPPEVWEERELKVGSPADFQGAERDVIFLSMVQPFTPGERISTLTKKDYLQRYNVAVSRAKDQVWLFHSIGFEELNPVDIRAKLLQYAYSIAEKQPEKAESVVVPNDERVEPFDSLFEQRVYNRIVEKGFTVIPQFEEFGYRIDLVVAGAQGRLAVECDGDYWHSEQNVLQDQHRQRELERLGWTFVRIFESDFYLDSDEQMQKVWDELDELGIAPFKADAPAFAPSDNVEVVEDVYAQDNPIEVQSGVETVLSTEEDVEDSFAESENNHVEFEPAREEQAPRSYSHDSGASALREEACHDFSYDEKDLSKAAVEYTAFEGTTVAANIATETEAAHGLLAILRAEGPMLGDFLFSRYVKSSGGVRVTKPVRGVLIPVLNRLVRNGSVEMAKRPDIEDLGKSTFYLPGHPRVQVRTLGPRMIHDVPYEELRVHTAKGYLRAGYRDRETVMRATLELLGLKNLTEKTRSTLLPHYLWVMDKMDS